MATAEAPRVLIRPSTRRTRTVSARWEGDDVVVLVPAHLSAEEQQRWADRMSADIIRKRTRHRQSQDDELRARADLLNDLYFEGRATPASIRWSTRQNRRWGSCTSTTREIRISHRLHHAPEWVLDAVVVHELAHILEANHSAAFRALERRYPRCEEADVWLRGYATGLAVANPTPTPKARKAAKKPGRARESAGEAS